MALSCRPNLLIDPIPGYADRVSESPRWDFAGPD